MTNYKLLAPDSVRTIVIHCSATPPNMDIGAKEIDLWHRQRGFAMIGYHKVIRRDGKVEDGRPLERPGAHAQGFNINSWGVCLVGGVTEAGARGKPEANYTQKQMDALHGLIAELLVKSPTARVLGHCDLPSPHARLKACPSFDVETWMETGQFAPSRGMS